MRKCDGVKIKYIDNINIYFLIGVFILFKNGQSAAKPRTEEGSTTIPIWEYICKCLAYGNGGHPNIYKMWMKI